MCESTEQQPEQEWRRKARTSGIKREKRSGRKANTLESFINMGARVQLQAAQVLRACLYVLSTTPCFNDPA